MQLYTITRKNIAGEMLKTNVLHHVYIPNHSIALYDRQSEHLHSWKELLTILRILWYKRLLAVSFVLLKLTGLHWYEQIGLVLYAIYTVSAISCIDGVGEKPFHWL